MWSKRINIYDNRKNSNEVIGGISASIGMTNMKYEDQVNIEMG